MAATICACPLRVPAISEFASLAIAHNGTVATGEFARAQSDCKLICISGDLTSAIMQSTITDRFKNLTIPGLAAFVQSARCCKYMRDLSSEVTTPIDASIIERDDSSVLFDQNLNRQRFTLRALQQPGGGPAGARFRLISSDMVECNNGVAPNVELPSDPFLLVYRNVQNKFNRPVVMAIAKPQENGSLLCIGISTLEMLRFLGGHSKQSVFNATRVPIGKKILPEWHFNPAARETNISVWGSDDSEVALVDKKALEDDSLNPIKIVVTPLIEPTGTSTVPLIVDCETPVGVVQPMFAGCVSFEFPASTCSEFSRYNPMALDSPEGVASILGWHESPHVAAVWTSSGPMIPNADRLVWNRPRRTRSEDLRSMVSIANIQPLGRRASVQRADIAIQRMAVEESLMSDGQYLPGHPKYAEILAEVDEMNERLEDDGEQYRIIDLRIKTQSKARVRTVLALAN